MNDYSDCEADQAILINEEDQTQPHLQHKAKSAEFTLRRDGRWLKHMMVSVFRRLQKSRHLEDRNLYLSFEMQERSSEAEVMGQAGQYGHCVDNDLYYTTTRRSGSGKALLAIYNLKVQDVGNRWNVTLSRQYDVTCSRCSLHRFSNH